MTDAQLDRGIVLRKDLSSLKNYLTGLEDSDLTMEIELKNSSKNVISTYGELLPTTGKEIMKQYKNNIKDRITQLQKEFDEL